MAVGIRQQQNTDDCTVCVDSTRICQELNLRECLSVYLRFVSNTTSKTMSEKGSQYQNSSARVARRSKFANKGVESSLQMLLAPKQPSTRRSSRAPQQAETTPSGELTASQFNIKTSSYHKPTPLLLVPYPSDVFPTDYNQRLPEWRVRAGNSAYQEHWRNWHEFQVAAVWANLGLTSLLGFPMLAAVNGRGTFVIAYVVLEFLIGFPVLFLELAVGQFSAKGPVDIFSLVPLAEGMVFVMVFASIAGVVYVNVYMSRLMFYMYAILNMKKKSAFNYEMPWTTCDTNEEDIRYMIECKLNKSRVLWNNPKFLCLASYYHHDLLRSPQMCVVRRHNLFIAQYFDWLGFVCLIIVSCCTYLFLIKGIKTIGRSMVWVYPVISFLLIIILAVSAIQEGAVDGVIYMITPNWEFVRDTKMWVIVTLHVLRSLNLDSGAMIVIASYAHFQSSAHYHAFFVCLVDVLVTLVVSCLVYCFAGIAANHYQVTMEDIMPSRLRDVGVYGFIWIATGLSKLWFSPMWGALFIMILLWFGETSLFAQLLVILQPLYQHFDHRNVKRLTVNLVVVVSFFVVSLPLIFTDGLTMYMVELFKDTPLVIYPMMVVALIIVVFVYCYGISRFCQDINFMLQYSPNKFFIVMWFGIPWLFAIVIVYAIIDGPQKTGSYEDTLVVWLIFVAISIPIPVVGLWNVYSFRKKGNLKSVLRPRDQDKWLKATTNTYEGNKGAPSTTTATDAAPESEDTEEMTSASSISFLPDLMFTRFDRTNKSTPMNETRPNEGLIQGEEEESPPVSRHPSTTTLYLISSDVKDLESQVKNSLK